MVRDMAKHKANRMKDAAKHHSSISAYVTRNSARPNAAAATNSTNTNNNDTPGRSVTNNVATSSAEDGTAPGEVDVASVTAPAPDADVNVANNNDQIATTNNNNAAAQDDTTTNTAAQDSDNGDNDDVKKEIDNAVNYRGRARTGRFDMYTTARPLCKWCRSVDCVSRDGWMQSPRRAHSRTRNVALLGRKYKCTVRRDAKLRPYRFRSIDTQVIEQSHDYVQMVWRMEGFDCSHKSAISLPLLRDLRSTVVQGLSINGFRHTILQQQREHHLMVSIQWRSYIHHVRKYPRIGFTESMIKDFPDFDSDEYDQTLPSVSWLIRRVVLMMESDNEYKKRRMQMIDGRHLSGDHSFKLTKCVMSGGCKAFCAIYCVLNEYSQVVAWWFTN
eukprot:scaffold931_cov57-Cyclotella_meneghiniana.AAC.3